MARGGLQATSGIGQDAPRAGARAGNGRNSRTITKQVRVSPAEDEQLKRVAASKGISVSELLRAGALSRRVPRRERGFRRREDTHPDHPWGGPVPGAAELERGGGGLEGTSGSGSAAAANDPVAGGVSVKPGAGEGTEASAPEFRCPATLSGTYMKCDFRSVSPRARCPVHGEKVVAA